MAFSNSFQTGLRRRPQKPPGLSWQSPLVKAAQATAQHSQGFTPYEVPTSAPPGTYDPSLDAQLENANQGLLWAGQDFSLNKNRLGEDFATQTGQLDTQHQWSLADLLTSRNRLGQDYQSSTADLSRGYANQGIRQGEAINAAGVSHGGALAQALAKRTANQGRDQGRLDQSFQRAGQDLTTNADRSNAQYDWQKTGLGTAFQRASGDALTGYQRQGVQNTAFGRQIGAQKVYEAQQVPGSFPDKPGNEFSHGGQSYRVEIHGGKKWYRLPDGRLVKKV